MTAIEVTHIKRQNETARNVLPANSEPREELLETLELFWNEGDVITSSYGMENTYVIFKHARTPFKNDRVFRVRIVEVGEDKVAS